ncbi:MAG: class I SAM-dependent methyltransferase, partial [Pseudomonadota bacterium]
GSFIPSVNAIQSAATRTGDMRLHHLEDIGVSYALTLREWRRRFVNRLEDVKRLDYPESFIRMWIFYLCYCEGGFLERSIGDAQLVFAKPRSQHAEILPDLSTL